MGQPCTVHRAVQLYVLLKRLAKRLSAAAVCTHIGRLNEPYVHTLAVSPAHLPCLTLTVSRSLHRTSAFPGASKRKLASREMREPESREQRPTGSSAKAPLEELLAARRQPRLHILVLGDGSDASLDLRISSERLLGPLERGVGLATVHRDRVDHVLFSERIGER